MLTVSPISSPRVRFPVVWNFGVGEVILFYALVGSLVGGFPGFLMLGVAWALPAVTLIG